MTRPQEGQTMRPPIMDRSIDIGMQLARKFFAKRGDHSEVHITELELAGLLALAVEESSAPMLLAALKECVTHSGAVGLRNMKYAKMRLAYITQQAEAAIRTAEGGR